MKKILMAIWMLAASLSVSAQRISVQEYIDTYKDIAISEMKRAGIPASITLAQGILETENGNSELVKKSSNHFGIKCKNTWTGSSVFHDDDSQGECFRKYERAEDSYYDHSNFLRGSSRYAFLFELDPMDYKGWAYGLKRAGYATNPQYSNILIKNIETNNLQQYDLLAANGNQVIKRQSIQGKITPVPDFLMKPVKYTEMNISVNIASIKAGKTLFNGLKAVFAPKGASLLAIATQFDISLSKLMEFNDLDKDGILSEEQWIFLEKKLKAGNRDLYIAEGGETIYSISQVNAIQLESLLQFNQLNKNAVLKKGTRVRLRPGGEKPVLNRAGPVIKTHEVLPKEGLYSISKKYHVPVEVLRALNNMTSDELKVGQQLIISK